MAAENRVYTLPGSGTLGGNRPRGATSPLARRPAQTTPIERQVPAPHNETELETVMGLLAGSRPRVSAISVGHARDDASRTAANAIIRAWTDHGGEVLGVVN